MNAEQKRFLSKIRKIIKSTDPADVEQGLELLEALDDPALWAVFSEGLSVNAYGLLVIPRGCEIYKRVQAAHRTDVALRALEKTGQLRGVTALHLNGCASLRDLSALQSCAALTTLNLYSCGSLQSLGGLQSCAGLTSLKVWRCGSLQDIGGLLGHANLTTLYICGETFAQLQARQALGVLRSIPNLTTLDVDDASSLQSVDGLQGCANLTRLDLSGCHALRNLDGLQGCEGLTGLDLSRCGSLRDIGALKDCTRLTSLNLEGCYGLRAQGIAPTRYTGAAAIRDLLSRA